MIFFISLYHNKLYPYLESGIIYSYSYSYTKHFGPFFRYNARVIEKEKYYFRGEAYWYLPKQIDYYNM